LMKNISKMPYSHFIFTAFLRRRTGRSPEVSLYFIKDVMK
jgi:hypothetical protein